MAPSLLNVAVLGALIGLLCKHEAPYPRALPVEGVPAGSLPHLTAIPEGAVDVSNVAERLFTGETYGAGVLSTSLIMLP